MIDRDGKVFVLFCDVCCGKDEKTFDDFRAAKSSTPMEWSIYARTASN